MDIKIKVKSLEINEDGSAVITINTDNVKELIQELATAKMAELQSELAKNAKTEPIK